MDSGPCPYCQVDYIRLKSHVLYCKSKRVYERGRQDALTRNKRRDNYLLDQKTSRLNQVEELRQQLERENKLLREQVHEKEVKIAVCEKEIELKDEMIGKEQPTYSNCTFNTLNVTQDFVTRQNELKYDPFMTALTTVLSTELPQRRWDGVNGIKRLMSQIKGLINTGGSEMQEVLQEHLTHVAPNPEDGVDIEVYKGHLTETHKQIDQVLFEQITKGMTEAEKKELSKEVDKRGGIWYLD